MALEKSTLDIVPADGLEQKADPRRLPPGSAAKAINLIKNKQGALEKRLGYTPLTKVAPASARYQHSQGLALGNWQGVLVTVGSGVLSTTSATTTMLTTYSDDSKGHVIHGPLPEFSIVYDQAISGAFGQIRGITSAQFQDLVLVTWTTFPISSVSEQIWAAVMEASTRQFVQEPFVLDGSRYCKYPRAAIVGNTGVISYADNTNNNIWAQTISMPAAKNGVAGWSGPIQLVGTGALFNVVNKSLLGTYDMRGITGNATQFMVAFMYQTGAITPSQHIAIAKYTLGSPLTFTSNADITNSTGAPVPSGYGLRCDASGASNVTALCYSYLDVSNKTHIAASAVFTSNMALVVPNPADVYAASVVEGASNQNFGCPTQLAVGWNQAGLEWFAGWSPQGSRWVNMTTPGNNARMMAAGFAFSGGVVITDPNNPRMTPGLHMCSRWLEANQGLYAVGWIPSATQGGFLVMSGDWLSLATLDSNPFTMRPVAQLGTRQCLADPFGVTNSGFQVGPNYYEAMFDWGLSGGDPYNTVTIVYPTSSLGQREIPAMAQIRTAPKGGWPMDAYGSTTAIGGALPCQFDGLTVYEQNFLWAPESLNATTTMNTTNTINSVSYIVTYEAFDSQGNFDISARSPALTLNIVAWNASGGLQTNITIPTLGATMRQPPLSNAGPTQFTAANSLLVYCGIYRTVLNAPAPLFYRIADKFFTQVDTANAVINNINATTVVFVDNQVSDAQLTDGTHPLLYGDGSNGQPGAIDNFCPPATPVHVRHKERLFVARGNLVMFSKFRSGSLSSIGPGYNESVDAFYVGGNDPVTGMATLDSALVVFKANEIYAVAGNGPADDGSGDAFDPPQRIQASFGCIDPRSVVPYKDGVYFMSATGLGHVSRSLSVEYVGGPIEDVLTAQPTIVGGVNHPTKGRVLLGTAAQDNASPIVGSILDRDYVLNAWTQHTIGYIQSGPTVLTQGPIAMAIAGANQFAGRANAVHFMAATGEVWRENDPNGMSATPPVPPYYDNGIYITWSWRSPAQQPGNQTLAGWARVWETILTVESLDPHNLTMNAYLDYDQNNVAYNASWSWSTDIQPGGVPQTPLTQVEGYMGLRGEAFQFEISDGASNSSVTGQGPRLVGLTLGVGTMPAPYRAPQTVRK